MVCYNNYNQPAMDKKCSNNCSCGCGSESSLSCIINLIIIVVVLQFLSQIICSTSCDVC